MKKIFNKAGLSLLTAISLPVIAQGAQLNIDLESDTSGILEFFYYDTASSDYIKEGYISIEAGESLGDYDRKKSADYRIVIGSPSAIKGLECEWKNEPGVPATIPIGETDIVLTLNLAQESCVVDYPFQHTLTMNFYLQGVSAENPVEFTVKQYDEDGEHIEGQDKDFHFTTSQWPFDAITIPDLHEDYSSAKLAHGETFCGFADTNLPEIDIATIYVRGIAMKNGNFGCKLFENALPPLPEPPTPPEPPQPPEPPTPEPPTPPEPLPLNISLYSKGVLDSGDEYALVIDQQFDTRFENWNLDYSQSLAINEDHTDTPEIWLAGIYEQANQVTISIYKNEIIHAACEFQDGPADIREFENIYVNFYVDPTQHNVTCLLYESAIQPQLTANFNVDKVMFRFYNVLANEADNGKDILVTELKPYSIERSIFGEYSFIEFIPPGFKAGSGHICTYLGEEQGSEKIAPTTDEILVFVDENNQCTLQ